MPACILRASVWVAMLCSLSACQPGDKGGGGQPPGPPGGDDSGVTGDGGAGDTGDTGSAGSDRPWQGVNNAFDLPRVILQDPRLGHTDELGRFASVMDDVTGDGVPDLAMYWEGVRVYSGVPVTAS
ncbi:MAG: hypothetical protein D6798_04650, partial [Deltaproteobacteria bacterium]